MNQIKKKNEKFQKLMIKLTKINERKLREIHQFRSLDYSFEKFVNNFISETLVNLGF